MTATEAEAAPVVEALERPSAYVVATKKLFVGPLRAERGPRVPDAPREPATAVLAVGGCDKANTAHVLTCLLQTMQPEAPLVVQVGIAGAFTYPGQTEYAQVGDVVLATEEIYSDTGSSSPAGWLSAAEVGLPIACIHGVESGGEFILDARLVGAAAAVIEAHAWSKSWPGFRDERPRVIVGRCLTSSRASGVLAEGEEIGRRWEAVAESMEGAAAAHVCALYDVPFLEIRGISNLVTDRDRASWEVDRAVRVAARAALTVAAFLDDLPLDQPAAVSPRAVPHGIRVADASGRFRA